VIGITHADHPDAWNLEDIQMVLADTKPTCPYVIVNATQPQSVAEALLALIQQLASTDLTEDLLPDELCAETVH
jgi:uncharacterized protein